MVVSEEPKKTYNEILARPSNLQHPIYSQQCLLAFELFWESGM